jgi:4-amino-4-deoxy-L-arabinose transferase-like glycosyltransferase
VYLATLAPGLTNANFGTDGGDLIAAARTLGVPHPSGYPTYTLLAWLFTKLPIGVIAYRVNLLSAVCAVVAIGLFYCTARRVLPDDRHPLLLPAITALILAFSSLLWSQAVIAEVYALLMLLASLLLWLLVCWRDTKRDLYLCLSALVLGLALGNHLTILFSAPAALVYLWPERRHWFRARTLLPAIVLFVLGLSVYAYLPLAARHRPPVNWGNPQTWRGFLWVVSGEQYQQFAFGLEPAEIPRRIAAWARLLGDQFGWWGLVISLIGAWGQWKRQRRFALFAYVWMGLVAVYAFFYDTGDSHMYLLPVVMLMALWWGEGAYLLLGLARSLRSHWQRLALVILILLPLCSVALHWRAVDPDDDWQEHTYIHQALDAVQPGGLVIVRADRPTFALWYGVYAEELRTDVQLVSGPLLAYVWYRDHIRHLYPSLVLNEPHGGNLTWDDLVYDLVASNWYWPTYLTDFKEEWREWFDITQVGDSPVYRVRLRESP